MMDNRQDIRLDEPLTPQIGGMIKGGICVLGVHALIAAIVMLVRQDAPDAMLMLAVVMAACIGGLLLIGWIGTRERLLMDDEAIRTRSLMGKVTVLSWDSIRTAAVVYLSANHLHCWIVLSAEADPAQVLVRRRLMRGKSCTDRDLRLPYGAKRRALIEEQLHMKLPEIQL